MAKRRSKAQITADKIIRKNLDILGEKIQKETKKITRVLTGRLKKSVNFRVEKDTQLVMTQQSYGKDVRPAGKNEGELNALMITVKKEIPIATEIMIKEIKESILYPFKNK
jgi:hypothetical protein